MLAEGELDAVGVAVVVLRTTEVKVVEILLEIAVLVLVVWALAVEVTAVVCCTVVLDEEEEEESGQNVIKRLALSSWHATWTQVSSGCLNAVLQLSESHVVPTPSQPP